MLADSQGRGMIIWPIALKLFQSVMLQQRPRFTGGRRIPVGDKRNAGTRPTLPWDEMNRPPNFYYGRYTKAPVTADTVDFNFALAGCGCIPVNLSDIRPRTIYPSVVHPLQPLPTEVRTLTGTVQDSALLPNAIVHLFRVDYDSGNNKSYIHIGRTVTDATGTYFFYVNRTSNYRVTADKSDLTKAGITLDTLSA